MKTLDIALLFSGQGAQHVGMGKDLAAAVPEADALFRRADDILGFALSDVMFAGPVEELTRTSRCQPALYVHGLACLEAVKTRAPQLRPVAAAGLSLGEFTAHAAAGTFDFETGLRLVHRRGSFMEEACEATEGSMAAIIGGSEHDVRRLAGACGVDIANLNAPGQIVVSGPKPGIARAIAEAKAFGCRMGKELRVAGAYHSRLMASAQVKLAAELADAAIRSPEFPVIANVLADEASGPDGIGAALVEQVTGSVRWSESIERIIDRGCSTFLEAGPGGVLAGLIARISKDARVIPAGDLESIEAIAAEIE